MIDTSFLLHVLLRHNTHQCESSTKRSTFASQTYNKYINITKVRQENQINSSLQLRYINA